MRAGRVEVIAHRGASADCPENTLAAFDEALHQGCDGIELDLQLTRDGVPVVYHDPTLAKLGVPRRRVESLDHEDLERIDAGAWLDNRFAGQHIPSLEQVLERYAGKVRLLLEIKSRERPGNSGDLDRRQALVRESLRLVRRARAEENTWMLSFDTDVLDSCAVEAPRVGRVLNVKPPRRLSPTLLGRLPQLAALSADVHTLTPGFGRAVRAAGTPLLVYTCNRPRQVERALAAGAGGVMSDRPGWLGRRLAQRDPHEA